VASEELELTRIRRLLEKLVALIERYLDGLPPSGGARR
jgi:hypothetical protein